MGNGAERAKLPVAALAGEAYRSVFGRIGLLFDRAWLPLLVVLAAALLPWFLVPGPGAELILGFSWRDLLQVAADLLGLSAFAVRWYGAVLFAPPRVEPRGIFVAAWPRFILYMLPLYATSAVALATLAGIADAAQGMDQVAIPSGTAALNLAAAGSASLAAALLTVRCALVFPAAAYGKPLGLGEAWRRMRGNTWRLIACVIITCLPPVFAASMLLDAIAVTARFGSLDAVAESSPFGGFILIRVVSTLVDFLLAALCASILAETYRALVIRDRREQSL